MNFTSDKRAPHELRLHFPFWWIATGRIYTDQGIVTLSAWSFTRKGAIRRLEYYKAKTIQQFHIPGGVPF